MFPDCPGKQQGAPEGILFVKTPMLKNDRMNSNDFDYSSRENPHNGSAARLRSILPHWD
jgi:hypothetical protein